MSGNRFAVFRVDASARSGGGHAVRSLALADKLSSLNWQCSFVVESDALSVVPLLSRSKHDVRVLPAGVEIADEPAWLRKTWPHGCTLAVFDSYRHDSVFEESCRGWAALRMAIDGTLREHNVDLLVNPVLGNSQETLAKLVPSSCNVLAGPRHSLVRPEFERLRPEALANRQARGDGVARVLVLFGSSDPARMTSVALKGLRLAAITMRIDVVAPSYPGGRQDLEDLIDEIDMDVVLHDGWVDEVSELMMQADLMISAAGGSVWEACSLGLPGIYVVVAENQRSVAQHLQAKRAALRIGAADSVTPESMAEAVRLFLRDGELRRSIQSNCADLCDGGGTRRVAAALVNAANDIASDAEG